MKLSNKIVRTGLLTLVIGAAASLTARADVTTNITVPNFSFEEYHTDGNSYANQTPNNNPGPTGILFDNWVTTSANFEIYQNPISNLGATPGTTQGTYYVDEDIPFGTVVTAETENPVATIDNNATYNLTVSLGVESGKDSANMSIELLAGNNIIAETDISQLTLDAAAGTFSDYSTSFSTLLGNDSGDVGQNLSIAIVTTPNNGPQEGEFDNVRLAETTVPEPGTWALMLLGSAGLVLLAHRKLVA
jgi:hypothetical protein